VKVQGKQVIVIHSGGMDSTLCLAEAKTLYGKENVLSLSFFYGQRHQVELVQAKKICLDWGIDHECVDVSFFKKMTSNALLDSKIQIEHVPGSEPNTLVVGRNGLMARLGAIRANALGASLVYLGVVEVDQSGYRDCSREYMDRMEEILRIDLKDPEFQIITPLVFMTKMETMERAKELGVLSYLLEETVSCYEGLMRQGCEKCPACRLKNAAIQQYKLTYPLASLPY